MIELPTPETDALFYKHGYPVEVETSKAMLLCEKLEQGRDFTIEKYKLLESCFKRAECERDEWRKKFELSVDAVEIAARLARAESERDEAREQLRIAVGLLSTHPQFANKHPDDVLAFVKETKNECEG
jgi:hypothetical protein